MAQKPVVEITPKELKSRLDGEDAPMLLDVRDANERAYCNIGGIHIPLSEIESRISEIPRDKELVVYCRSGGRSGRAVQFLQTHGFFNLLNLAGGILRWSDEVDPSIPKY